MVVLRAATVLAIAMLIATPALAQDGTPDYTGYGPGFDTGDLAPGYEVPGQFPLEAEREQVTPFGEEPAAGGTEQDAPINVIGGQTERFERGIIGDALHSAKGALFGAVGRDRTE